MRFLCAPMCNVHDKQIILQFRSLFALTLSVALALFICSLCATPDITLHFTLARSSSSSSKCRPQCRRLCCGHRHDAMMLRFGVTETISSLPCAWLCFQTGGAHLVVVPCVLLSTVLRLQFYGYICDAWTRQANPPLPRMYQPGTASLVLRAACSKA